MKKWIFNGGTLILKELYGVQRYTYEILKQLDTIVQPGVVELALPCVPAKEIIFRNIKVVIVDCSQDKTYSKFVWNHIIFPRYVRKNKGLGIDLLLALPLWGCDVVAIHDCIVELFPENAKTTKEKLGRLFYLFRSKIAIKRSKLVITVSNSSKNDISKLHNCPMDKIQVIPNSWEHFAVVKPDESIIERLGLSDKTYFFSLGSRYFHKNFRWVQEAARQNNQYNFVVTGSSSLNSSDKDIEGNELNNLVFTGYLSDQEIKALMQNCKAFIQPSLYEGFGIPPMEAMCAGCKCIVSNRSALPEVYQNSVWYIEPEQYESINMDKIMDSQIEDNSEVLNRFSWLSSAKKLKRCLEKIG